MKVWQTDGKWYLETDGGRQNQDEVPGDRVELEVKPEPVERWNEHDEPTRQGAGVSRFTRFRAGEKVILVKSYTWYPANGYSWHENWESVIEDRAAPALGEAFRWTGSGWEAIEHPQAAQVA